MVKKVIIIILLIVSLILTVFPQTIDTLFDADISEIKEEVGFWMYPLMFWAISTCLLFWLGIYVGWNFARDQEWTLVPILICTLIAMYFSLPIAIFQLLRRNN